MEERDVQIRGYKIRLPLDVYRGRLGQPRGLHEPRPDHHAAQGPLRLPDPHALSGDRSSSKCEIMEQERHQFETDGVTVTVPKFMKEIVAELTHQARHSHDVSQRSGVSVRMSRRQLREPRSRTRSAARSGSARSRPRRGSAISPRCMLDARQDRAGDAGRSQRGRVFDRMINSAVLTVFNRTFSIREFDRLGSGVRERPGGRDVGADAVDGLRASAQPSGRHEAKRRQARRRRQSGGGGVGGRVRARGIASESSAEQGDGNRRGAIPPLKSSRSGNEAPAEAADGRDRADSMTMTFRISGGPKPRKGPKRS